MWWAEFEKRLTRAFNAYVKREQRIVHSDSMKIRMLIDKIKADFLTPTKAQLEIELSRVPMTMTYEQSLALFRNMVNQKHPPQVGAANYVHAVISMKPQLAVVRKGTRAKLQYGYG
jgi:hypothetical protein